MRAASEALISINSHNCAQPLPSLVGEGSGYLIDLTDLDCRLDGKRQRLGTLTFHRLATDENVGYADIDIACIPKLKRILYMTEIRGISGCTRRLAVTLSLGSGVA